MQLDCGWRLSWSQVSGLRSGVTAKRRFTWDLGPKTWDLQCVPTRVVNYCTRKRPLPRSLLHLDFDVDARREIQLRQRVHRLRTRVENVDYTLCLLYTSDAADERSS